MSAEGRKRVAILISGGGSNMVTLAKSMVGDHPARPCLVLSNVPVAGGLKKADCDAVVRDSWYVGDLIAELNWQQQRKLPSKPDRRF